MPVTEQGYPSPPLEPPCCIATLHPTNPHAMCSQEAPQYYCQISKLDTATWQLQSLYCLAGRLWLQMVPPRRNSFSSPTPVALSLIRQVPCTTQEAFLQKFDLVLCFTFTVKMFSILKRKYQNNCMANYFSPMTNT